MGVRTASEAAARTDRRSRHPWCSVRCCAASAPSRSPSAARRSPRTAPRRALRRTTSPRPPGWPALAPAAARASEIRAGTTEVSRIPSRCRFSATGKVATSPSAPRATITESSHSRSSRASRTQGTPPKRSNARTASSSLSTVAWPLPSYPSRLVLRRAGRGIAPSAARSSRLFRTTRKRSGGEAVALQEALLGAPVLGDGHRFDRRADQGGPGEPLEGGGGDVLELGGDRGAARAESSARARLVVVGRADVPVGYGAGGALRVRIEHHDPVSHGAGLQGEHPAQLSASDDADRGAGKDHEGSGSFRSSTRRSWVRRNSSSRSLRSASLSARMATA